MITITMTKVTGTGPNGTKAIVADDGKNGIRLLILMEEDAARTVAAALTSGLVLASKIPNNGAS